MQLSLEKVSQSSFRFLGYAGRKIEIVMKLHLEVKIEVHKHTDHDKFVEGIKRPMSFILLVIHKDGFLKENKKNT